MSDLSYDYQKYAILFVDDEEKTRKYFRRLYGDTFRILEAGDGVQALAVFREHASEIGIIVTDQRMPNETGVGFLSKISDQYPDVIKILSTAYSDLDAAIGSVNRGGIYRYITKPWEVTEFEVTLRRAMEFFIIKHELNMLMGAKVQALGNVIYSARLASFALAPAVAGLPVKHAAEAVASFVRIGAFGAAAGGRSAPMDAGVGSWRKVYDAQVRLAGLLESALKAGFAGGSTVAARTAALAQAIGGAITQDSGEVFRIEAPADPFPAQLAGLFGVTGKGGEEAIPVLAALIGVYDAGASVMRLRGVPGGLALDVKSGGAATEASPGSDVARWLFDDDLLISSALGLL